MQKSKTCYIDVTQLVHWQGYVAGIPRVMYELSRRFISDETTKFVYVSWVKELGAFCEVDFFSTIEAKKRGEGGIKYVSRNQESLANTAPHETRSLSFAARPKRLVKKVLVKAGIDDTRLVHRIKAGAASLEVHTYKQIQFAEGDSIFISWGEWWDENFLALLEAGVKNVHLSIVPIIHDVLPFTQTPQFSGHSTDSLEAYCRRVVSISKLVLCVSKSTKNDLAQWFRRQEIELPRMEVFRLGEDFEFKQPAKPQDPVFKQSGLRGGDYLIVVGTVEAKKNHTLLYYVYKLARARDVDLPKIVIVGRKGWKTEAIVDFMQGDPEVKDKFVFLHNVSDEELSWLYDHALLSVFPSFAEGWGMPIAESIARGVPCLCSNTTSMIEIAEDYVKHFSPASTDECLQAIIESLQPKELARMKKKCQTYKQTTWDESYEQVRRFMKEVVDV